LLRFVNGKKGRLSGNQLGAVTAQEALTARAAGASGIGTDERPPAPKVNRVHRQVRR
jgi:hypothetical protein